MQKKRPSIRSTITRISWVFFNIMDELKNLIPIFKSLIFSQYPQSQLPSVMEEVLTNKNGDQFIEITVSEPQKVGDGMGSYIAFK